MNFEQLESFVAVIRRGSFTLAAQELHRSQPGVTRHVQRLQGEIGAPLFERRQGALELTDAGRRLLAFAEDVLRGHAALLQDVARVEEDVEGDLRIAASTTPGEFVVPAMLAGFVAAHPGVRPELFIADSTVVATELREGRWDLGFVGMRVPGSRLRYEVVADDEIVLAASHRHPFAGGGVIELEQLEGQPFIEREDGSGTLRMVRDALREHGQALPNYHVVMVLNTTHAVVSAVEQGYGLGWVSIKALEAAPSTRVRPVRLAGLPIRRPLYLVQNDRYPPSTAGRAFIEWVRRQRDAAGFG